MAGADLHIHSNASDGRYSPAELIRMAVNAGLTVMALTDHDTVDGIVPALQAAKEFPVLTVIPGVELSTDTSNGEVHVLGYFIDYTNHEFQASLEKMRNSRANRADKMVAKLNELGCNVEARHRQSLSARLRICQLDCFGQPVVKGDRGARGLVRAGHGGW